MFRRMGGWHGWKIKAHGASRNAFLEVSVRVLLLVAFLITEDMDPFQRVIHPEEMWWYKNPHAEHSTISTQMLFSTAILVPFCVILIFSFIQRDQLDLIHGTLAYTLAELLDGIITNSIKLVIARPRPDFFYRCFPDGVEVPGLKCTGDPDTISEGRKSFPSGHSSFSFCAFGFVTFYLAGKLHTFESQGRGVGWKILVTFLPLYCALMIALSRTSDYRHHFTDVLVGSLLGLAIAYAIYLHYYPALSHASCDKSFASLYAIRDSMYEPHYSLQDTKQGADKAQVDNIKLV